MFIRTFSIVCTEVKGGVATGLKKISTVSETKFQYSNFNLTHLPCSFTKESSNERVVTSIQVWGEGSDHSSTADAMKLCNLDLDLLCYIVFMYLALHHVAYLVTFHPTEPITRGSHVRYDVTPPSCTTWPVSRLAVVRVRTVVHPTPPLPTNTHNVHE